MKLQVSKVRLYHVVVFISLLIALCSVLFAQNKRPMELEDLFRIKRVSDPQLSPDGKWVAYVVVEVDKAANKTNSDIWLIPSAEGEARQLTNSPRHDRHPRWSPDGKWIAFSKTYKEPYGIFIIPSDGGQPRRLADSGKVEFWLTIP